GRDAHREQVDDGAADRGRGAEHEPRGHPQSASHADWSREDDSLAAERRRHLPGAAPPQVTAGGVGDPYRVIFVGQRRAVEVLQYRGVGARWYLRRALRGGERGRAADQDAPQADEVSDRQADAVGGEGDGGGDRDGARHVAQIERRAGDEEEKVEYGHRSPPVTAAGRAGQA